ncbi:MAG: redoxin domain-containing protein [Chloroflexi bacterium]|nr:redoxin domain-containing protein [Chloroflexota bacterium]MYC01028.1 redoxin domain-containing protein [Chloroflexota bacterium]MYD52728.1 redoxin domain-containing protein [Chloroflexota bacterium]
MSRFQELHQEFQEAGAQVLGISVDSPFANGAYAIELGLEFPLLGDFPWGRTGKAWGILNEERGITSRTTYVIDPDGVVRHIIDAPRDFNAHPEGALEFIKTMEAAS